MEWIVLSFAFFLVFIILFVDAVLRQKRSFPLSLQREVMQKWENIGNIADVQRQILEIDKLFDFILTKKGYQGSYAAKLKKMKGTVGLNIEHLWYIHKKRNQIAHEVDVYISESDQKKILLYGQEALRKLGINI